MVDNRKKPKKESNVLRYRAYRAIKDKIIYLEFKPGEKIFENILAQELDVSRTPVREALLMLEHEKLVTCSGSLGFVVRRFSLKDIEEYFALRIAIENFVLPLVVEKVTEEEVSALRANVAEGKRVIKNGDIRAIIRCETEFHEMLYRAAKSDILFDTISGLVDKFVWFRAIALSVPEAAASSLSHHKKMIDLILKKDIEALKAMMRFHLHEARGRVIGLVGLLL